MKLTITLETNYGTYILQLSQKELENLPAELLWTLLEAIRDISKYVENMPP